MYKWKFILNSDVVKDIETIIKLNQLLKFVFCGWITFWEWIRNAKYWCDVWMKGNVSLIKGEMVWVKLQSNYCFSNNQIIFFSKVAHRYSDFVTLQSTLEVCYFSGQLYWFSASLCNSWFQERNDNHVEWIHTHCYISNNVHGKIMLFWLGNN